MTLKIGLTPFANDTFLFYGFIHRLIDEIPASEVKFADLESLNTSALEGDGDVLKISFNCLGQILDDYVLLPVGSCLGYKNGPKIVAKTGFDVSNLSQKRI